MKVDKLMYPHLKFIKIAKISFLSAFLLVGVFSVGVRETRGDTICIDSSCINIATVNLNKRTYNSGEPIIASGNASSFICSNFNARLSINVNIDGSAPNPGLWSGTVGHSGYGSATFNTILSTGTHNANFVSCGNIYDGDRWRSCVGHSIPFTVIAPNPPPTVTIAAIPTTVTTGGTSDLTWSSTNATQCTASGDWSGSKDTTAGSHTENTGVLNTRGNKTYALTCTGLGGSATAVANVAVVGPPTVTLTATPDSVVVGNSSTLTWSSTDSTSCTASGDWSGSKDTTTGSHTESTGALSTIGTKTYTLTCSGPGGAPAVANATVGVTPPFTPSCTVDTTTPTRGGSANFSIAFTGGRAPYTSNLQFDGGAPPPASAFSVSNPSTSSAYNVSIAISPRDTSASHTLSGTVRDSAGATQPISCPAISPTSGGGGGGGGGGGHPPIIVGRLHNVALQGSKGDGILYGGSNAMTVNKNQAFSVIWTLNNATRCQLSAVPPLAVIGGAGGTSVTSSNHQDGIVVSADTVFTLDGCYNGALPILESPTLEVKLNRGSTVSEQ